MEDNVVPHLRRALLERGVPYTRQVAERATAHIEKTEYDSGSELHEGSDGNVAGLKRYVEEFLEANPDVPRLNLTGADRSSQKAGMKRYKASLHRSDSKSYADARVEQTLSKLRARQK